PRNARPPCRRRGGRGLGQDTRRLGRHRELRGAPAPRQDRPDRPRTTARQDAARMTVLAIDAGTTGVTALVVTEDGRIASRGYQEFPQHFPQPGWVEHEPEEIWQATLRACNDALR